MESRPRPSSEAFRDDPDGHPMSVFIESESVLDYVLAGHTGFKVASVGVAFVRSLQFAVARDPLPSNFPPGHAVVIGDKRARKRDKKLAKQSQCVLGPSAVEIEQEIEGTRKKGA